MIAHALQILAERLPPGWTVEQIEGQGAGSQESDALFSFKQEYGGGSGLGLVTARTGFAPADVERLFGGFVRRLREASGSSSTIILVSDFLSPRTRELLEDEEISYVDLTGNVRLVMRQPGLYVQLHGADRRPSQGGRQRLGLSVGRVIRFLTEVAPPYGVTEIADATGISRGYVSRILDRLANEALLRREPRGPVEWVDWPALLRARGSEVDLFGSGGARMYVSPNGARRALEGAAERLAAEVVVTGSFAAVEIAPIAAPALLVLYVRPHNFREITPVAEGLGLRDTDAGADVILIRPPNDWVLDDPRPMENGLSMVNLPQLVIDCLGGTGRMPAEGEAVLTWMAQNEDEWRAPSLTRYLEGRA